MLRATAALLLAGASARGIDPQYAENLTLYHVNPLHEGVIPSDMDTSDLNGDIFFDLKSALVVEVDSRFGEYGMCNICVNGTDPLSRLPCATGEYICVPKYDRFRRRPSSRSARPAVGRENISQTFGRYGDCTWDKYVEEPWGCWSGNVWKKAGGEWYSAFKGARRDAPFNSDDAAKGGCPAIPVA
ncbi:methyltransferase [Aureococcus anophagefferens]|nr:methyltransferase [Aureococcus anophagefferens]